MVATTGFGVLSGSRGVIAGGVAGMIVVAIVATLPTATLDLLMWRLWLPHLVSAATPPIGGAGRAILAVAGGLATAGAVILMAGLIASRRRALDRRETTRDVPVLRRADAHPDAPARRPIRAAADFGAPLPLTVVPAAAPPPEPERPLPTDLDQPLAAFDPAALPDTPRAPVRAVAALAPRPALIDPGERFETFQLTPVTRAAAPAESRAEDDAPPQRDAGSPARAAVTSITSLIERLERVTPRRGAPAEPVRNPANLDETLVMLRRLATG